MPNTGHVTPMVLIPFYNCGNQSSEETGEMDSKAQSK